MKKAAIVVGLFFLLALGSGCAQFGSYMKDRGNDFLDCFKLQAGLGLIADAEARATDLFSAGAGLAGGTRWGIDGRHIVGFGERMGLDLHVGFPFAPIGFWIFQRSREDEDNESNGIGRYFYTDYNIKEGGSECIIVPPETWSRRTSKSILFLDMTIFERYREPEEWPVNEEGLKTFYIEKERKLIDAFEFEVGATLGISARVGFSLGQFLDFITGWFGVDLAGDDTNGMNLFEKYNLKGISGEIVFQEGSYRKTGDDSYKCTLRQYYRRPTGSYIIIGWGVSAGESTHLVEFTITKRNDEFILESFSYDERWHHSCLKYEQKQFKLNCELWNGVLKGKISGKITVHPVNWCFAFLMLRSLRSRYSGSRRP